MCADGFVESTQIHQVIRTVVGTTGRLQHQSGVICTTQLAVTEALAAVPIGGSVRSTRVARRGRCRAGGHLLRSLTNPLLSGRSRVRVAVGALVIQHSRQPNGRFVAFACQMA